MMVVGLGSGRSCPQLPEGTEKAKHPLPQRHTTAWLLCAALPRSAPFPRQR
jgi:hypothetical protein